MGRYGVRVRIFEKRPGAPLHWDYRAGDSRTRPEVRPEMYVRATEKDAVDALLERAAVALCEQKAANLAIEPSYQSAEPPALTLGHAYALYFDEAKKALPPSPQARRHHHASKAFWLKALGINTKWDAIAPADVRAALWGLKEQGKVSTATKRLANLRTLSRWLVTMMGFDQLRDPIRGIDKKKITEGYEPRRPRYTADEIERLVEAAFSFGERFYLFVVLMADSGARAVQVRQAMRSGLDCELEPPPPPGFAPHGWLRLPAVKGQGAMLTALTKRQRHAVTMSINTFLAPLEDAWRESGVDYPLLPGEGWSRGLGGDPISDTALRRTWKKLEAKAGIEEKERRAFHGSRRSWSDDIFESEGLDTVASAGGWARRETPESIYLSRQKYGHIDRARKRREKND